jgi:glyoxylase-like metal-dependent hydrolase (beta-lactamase superfamily II)
VLVDCGFMGSAPMIVKAAAQRFGADARPAAIVLTHGHFDHVGALENLARLWDCPVYAHRLELPYITGRASYPPFDPSAGGGGQTLLSPLFPRGPWNVGARARELPEDGSVPFADDWKWIPTPGHSPGHVSLVRDNDRTVIAGDAVITTKQESTMAVMTQAPMVRRPPAYATTDWQAARASVETIAAYEPELLATGHGVPMRGQAMRDQLETLAREFSRVGIPPRGRYVWQPATADETGPLTVPPPVPTPEYKYIAAAGLALLAGYAVAKLMRRDGNDEEYPELHA